MFSGDMESEHWVELVDHSVWLRLAKLASGGAVLDGEATARFAALTFAHSQWRLATNESDEFTPVSYTHLDVYKRQIYWCRDIKH